MDTSSAEMMEVGTSALLERARASGAPSANASGSANSGGDAMAAFCDGYRKVALGKQNTDYPSTRADLDVNLIGKDAFLKCMPEQVHFEQHENEPYLGKASIKFTYGSFTTFLMFFVVNVSCGIVLSAKNLSKAGVKLYNSVPSTPSLITKYWCMEGKSVSKNTFQFKYFRPDLDFSKNRYIPSLSETEIRMLNACTLSIDLQPRAAKLPNIADSNHDFSNMKYDGSFNNKIYIELPNCDQKGLRIGHDEQYVGNLMRENAILDRQTGQEPTLPLTMPTSIDEYIVFLENKIGKDKKPALSYNEGLLKHLHTKLGHVNSKKLLSILRTTYRVTGRVEEKIVSLIDSCGTCAIQRNRPPSNNIALPRARSFNAWVNIDLRCERDGS